MTTAFAVEFHHVGKRYGQIKVVRDLNLNIPSGKITVLIGPSGCGKTTTLKMINRLVEPTEGRILVEGQDIGSIDPVELRRNIGYVIQQIGLFPHMTVEENITLVPRLKGQDKRAVKRRAEELLELVGLDPARFRHRYPRELSGGQQQRIGVARALAADPDIILMDEPFSALDPISREQLQDEFMKLEATVQKTIIFVTHDMDEALKIADQVILMRDGEVVQAGSPEQLLRHPKDDFVREFVGEKRFQQLPAAQKIRDVMVRAVTIRPGAGCAQAVWTMRQHGVNGLVVVDVSGRFLGVIGAQEIYDYYGEDGLNVADIMSKQTPTVGPDDVVSTVLPLLQSDGRSFVPVVDADERLLGVVTRASVIDALARPYLTAATLKPQGWALKEVGS